MRLTAGFLFLCLFSTNLYAAPLCFKEKRASMIAAYKLKATQRSQKSLIKRSERASATLESKQKRFNSKIASNEKQILVNQSKYDILCAEQTEDCSPNLLKIIERLTKNNISLALRVERLAEETAELEEKAAQSEQVIAEAQQVADEKAQALEECKNAGQDEENPDNNTQE